MFPPWVSLPLFPAHLLAKNSNSPVVPHGRLHTYHLLGSGLCFFPGTGWEMAAWWWTWELRKLISSQGTCALFKNHFQLD